MRLRLEYGHASVYYEDSAKHPTPEHVDDLIVRIERSLQRIWEGKTLEAVDLSDFDTSTE